MVLKLTKTTEKRLGLIEKENLSKTTDMSKRLGITPAGVHRHLKKLRGADALKFGCSINYAAFGQIQAMFLLELFRPADRKVIDNLKEIANVKRVMGVDGDYDYIIFAVFKTEQEMRQFLTTVLSFNTKIKSYKVAMLGREFI